MSFKVGEKVIVECYFGAEEMTVLEVDENGDSPHTWGSEVVTVLDVDRRGKPTKFQDKNGTIMGLGDIFYFFKKIA